MRLRSKLLLPFASLIVVALGAMAILGLNLASSSKQYEELIFGPRLAARVAIVYSGALSEVGSVVNLALLEGDTVKLDALARERVELKAERKVQRAELERLLPQRAAELREMKERADKINENLNTLVEKLRQHDRDAPKFWAEQGRPVLSKQRAALKEISDAVSTSSDKATADSPST